jgi:DNA-binding response OmpR family regulator
MAHILIIDDEVLIRRSVRKFLEMSGHSVEEAEDGQAGIRMHASLLYDVVITDVNMPGFSGTEVVRELRRVDEGVKLIVITGGGKSDTSPVRKGPLAVGDVVSLQKPFSLQELLDVVNLLTGQTSST